MPLDQLESSRAPSSFAQFKFSTIGQEPQLLKRLSAPVSIFSYSGPNLPTPSSISPEGDPPQTLPSRSHLRLPVVEALDIITDTIMSDGTNEIASTSLQTRSPNSYPGIGNGDLSLSPVNQPGHPRSGIDLPSPTISEFQIQKRFLPDSSPKAINISISAPTMENAHASVDSITSEIEDLFPPDSPLTTLRDLHARLLLSLADLHPPNISNALVLAQNANSHATNALSAAQRAYTLAQQSLSSAKDAVRASQDCLRAAEQAKADASDAVAAVDHLGSGNRDFGSGSNEGGQWRSVLVRLQDDLRTLGEWVHEREAEETNRKQDEDKRERTMIHEILAENPVSNATQSWDHSNKETQTGETDANSGSEWNVFPMRVSSPGEIRRPNNVEADTAINTESIQQDFHLRPAPVGLPGAMSRDVQSNPAETPPVEENACLRSTSEVEIVQQAKHEPVQLQVQGWQPISVPSETYEEKKRMNELHNMKLEIARFQISERKRIAEEAGQQLMAEALQRRSKAPAEVVGSPVLAPYAPASPKQTAIKETTTIAKRLISAKDGEDHRPLRPTDQLKSDQRGKEPDKSISHRQIAAQEPELISPRRRRSQDGAYDGSINIVARGDEHTTLSPDINRTISLETEDNFPYLDQAPRLMYPPSLKSRIPSEISKQQTLHLLARGHDLGNMHVTSNFQPPPTPSGARPSVSGNVERPKETILDTTPIMRDSLSTNEKSLDDNFPDHEEPVSNELSRDSKMRDSKVLRPSISPSEDGKENMLQSPLNLHAYSPPSALHIEPPHVQEQTQPPIVSPRSRSSSSKTTLIEGTSPLSPTRPANSPVVAQEPFLEQTHSKAKSSPVLSSTSFEAAEDPPLPGDSQQLEFRTRERHDDDCERNVHPTAHETHIVPPTREISGSMSRSPVDRPPPLISTEKITRAKTPTPLPQSPPPPSPVLGKRRYNDSPRLDEHLTHRQWLSQNKSETSTYVPRGNSASSKWRPSAARSSLQTRIVPRDAETVMIGNGQSYRPSYPSNSFIRDSYQPSAEESVRSAASERFKYDDRYVPDPRDGPESAYSRGRSSSSRGSNTTRGGYRGRGGYGGNRPLNLEQRISSTRPPALLNRLGSPLNRR